VFTWIQASSRRDVIGRLAALLHTEVLCGHGSVCSSQESAVGLMLGTSLGDRLRDAQARCVGGRGNKKGHLLAFLEAL
jgi:hypothetical protein